MAYTPEDTTILDEVGTRLSHITSANGYNNEFKKIRRARLTPFKGYDLPAANYYHGSVTSEKTKYGKLIKTMALVIETHSKTQDTPFIDLADELAADVVIGLFRATANPAVSDAVSIALGGIVEEFVFTGHSPFIGEGEKPFCGTLVNFNVVYETDIGDM